MIEIERYTFLGTWLTHYTVDLEKKVKCSNENTKMRCSPENVYAFGTGMLDIHTEIFQVIWQFDVSRRDERLLHGPTTFTKTHTHTHRVLQIQSDKSTNAIYEQSIIYRNDSKETRTRKGISIPRMFFF